MGVQRRFLPGDGPGVGRELPGVHAGRGRDTACGCDARGRRLPAELRIFSLDIKPVRDPTASGGARRLRHACHTQSTMAHMVIFHVQRTGGAQPKQMRDRVLPVASRRSVQILSTWNVWVTAWPHFGISMYEMPRWKIRNKQGLPLRGGRTMQCMPSKFPCK